MPMLFDAPWLSAHKSMFEQAKYLAFKVLGNKFLNFAKVVVEQDVDILGKKAIALIPTIKLLYK